MITRTVPCPVSMMSNSAMLGEYKAPGVTIAPVAEDPAKLRITAPDEAAADAAEVWLAEMDTPAG